LLGDPDDPGPATQDDARALRRTKQVMARRQGIIDTLSNEIDRMRGEAKD
jgi:hypothetical protein